MSLVLDSSPEYAKTATVPVSAKPLTVVAWFKCTDATAAQDIVTISNGSVRLELQCRGSTSGDPIGALERQTAYAVADTSSGYTTGTWHHAAATFVSATSRSAWIDGGSKVTDTASQDINWGSVNQLRIGDQSGGVGQFAGKIAEVAVWSSELSDANIALLAGGANPGDIESGTLEAYWPLLDDFLDDSGNNNTLTNNNATFDDTDSPPVSNAIAEGIKTVTAAAVVSVSTEILGRVEVTKTVTAVASASLVTESHRNNTGFPTGRPSDYDPDTYWDEATGTWLSTSTTNPGRWSQNVVTVSEEGEIYFGTV